MSDPVAEAAANLAKAHAEPSLIEEIKEGVHDLAEKVDHLIHPEAESVPNVASGAAESTTGTASAASASGNGETSSTGENSAEQPLHVRVAAHLEAIFSMVKEHVEAAPAAAVADTSALKTHVGDILHRISNGMHVSEGELVQKLESLYRML